MKYLFLFLTLFANSFLPTLSAQSGGELRFCLRSEPKTFDPLQVADDSSETVRYLTGGVLIRINRLTQELEPELATSWKISDGGRKIDFRLREAVAFSDGSPFSAEDVAFTFRALMDPKLHSPTGDSFRSSSGAVETKTTGAYAVSITFPAPVAGLERLFDQVAVLSSRSPRKEGAVLGPFIVSEHKTGSHVLLQRNPYYWKRDERGRRLPYLDSIRLEVQQNQEMEMLRFRKGRIHLINNMDAALFDRLTAEMPSAARDAGTSMDSEQMWFNQVSSSPIADYKKTWFRSRNFRRAISEAINREDICRVVYMRHASPAIGPVSPANQFWFNKVLKPHTFDVSGALRRLTKEGFRMRQGTLFDGENHPVEFSLITNSGNKAREKMATMVQHDLKDLGIQLNIVTLDFLSLIERITRTFNYEACLLGLVNIDLDPNAQMNVWLSSASNHQWSPNQKSPETRWEAEIDRLMQAQASTMDRQKRKASFDRVQQIVWEEAPFIYLINKNSLAAISPTLHNATPVSLRPQTYWNAEWLYLNGEVARTR
jgi:peptide/nickel transport system substrate-binding protein